jgi:hypothetical protein
VGADSTPDRPLPIPGGRRQGSYAQAARGHERTNKNATITLDVVSDNLRLAGRGAAWLARQSGGLEVPSSNLGAPMREAAGNGGFSVDVVPL